MSEATEELSTVVRESSQLLEQTRDLAGLLAGQTTELAEEAAAHGWHGISEAMAAAAEALDGVTGRAQSAGECCDQAVTALNRITDFVSVGEVIKHLGVAGGQLTEASSQTEAAIARAEEATEHADQVGQQGLQGALPELNDLLSTTRERLQAHQSALDAELEQAKTLAAETVTAAAGSGTAGSGAAASGAAGSGKWATPPPRAYGDPFNQQYEEWVRTTTGGPRSQEYLIEHGGEEAWFDAVVVSVQDGLPTETLIDAKGRYQQFIDNRTGYWHKWWSQSKDGGLTGMTRTARRQVHVANGRSVEWHCAEQDVADAFNRLFRSNARLNGRVRAVYRPMPESGTDPEDN